MKKLLLSLLLFAIGSSLVAENTQNTIIGQEYDNRNAHLCTYIVVFASGFLVSYLYEYIAQKWHNDEDTIPKPNASQEEWTAFWDKHGHEAFEHYYPQGKDYPCD